MNKFYLGFIFASFFCSSLMAQEFRSIPVDKVLTFWDKYLSLPYDKRDGFLLKYKIFTKNNQKIPKIEISNNGIVSPINLEKDGTIINMPSLANFKTTKVNVYGKTKIMVGLDAIPLIPLANRIKVSSLQNALLDYKEGIKIGGPAAALIAPKLNSIVFYGANSGEAIFPDGRKIPLQKHEKGLIFTNNKTMEKATYLEFNIAPKDVAFEK